MSNNFDRQASTGLMVGWGLPEATQNDAVCISADSVQSTITTALNRQEGKLGNLDEAISELIKAIEPVLSPAFPNVPNAAPGQSQPKALPVCTLHDQIALQTEGVVRLTNLIYTTKSRLRV